MVVFPTDLIEPLVLVAVTIWNLRRHRAVKDEPISIRIEIRIESGRY